MDPDETVSPDAETQNQAAETTDEPVVVEPDAAADEQAAKPEQSEADKALQRMQRRIDKRTGDYHRAKGELEALRAENEALKAKSAGTQETAEPDEVEALAEHKSQVRDFARQAAQIVTDGKRAHTDFDEAIAELTREVGPLVLKNGLPSPFMSVVFKVADDVKAQRALMYHLGKNPDLAEELADLSREKLAVRLDRIQSDLAERSKPKPSNAPKALETVKGVASQAKPPEAMSDKEYDAWRASRKASR
jgi:hypothetical protein